MNCIDIVSKANVGDPAASKMIRQLPPNHIKNVITNDFADYIKKTSYLPWSMHILALMHYYGVGEKQDYKKAFELFENASRAGNPSSVICIASMHKEGNGVPEDLEKAFDILRKEARAGNGDALCKLALLYDNGDGISKNEEKAIELFQKAGEKENALAFSELAIKYKKGKGVAKDSEKAIELFHKAADFGNLYSIKYLAKKYKHGKIPNINGTHEKAIELYEKGAQLGDVSMIRSLARIYKKGKIVEKNIEKAKELYFFAAELRSLKAFHALMDMDQIDKDDCLKLGGIYKRVKKDLPDERNADLFGRDIFSRLYCLYEQHNILPKLAKILTDMDDMDNFYKIIRQILMDPKCDSHDLIELITYPNFDKMFDNGPPKIVVLLRNNLQNK